MNTQDVYELITSFVDERGNPIPPDTTTKQRGQLVISKLLWRHHIRSLTQRLKQLPFDQGPTAYFRHQDEDF